MFKWFRKAPLPPPTIKEALHAEIMLAIADGYDKSDGSFLTRSALRGAAKKIRREYAPIIARYKVPAGAPEPQEPK